MNMPGTPNAQNSALLLLAAGRKFFLTVGPMFLIIYIGRVENQNLCVIHRRVAVERRKIYCAGPLFNPKEREEMSQIASVLENAGYSVFLPQRDGLEFAKLFPLFMEKGVPASDARKILNMAIFSLDVFQIVKNSDGLLLNMNGRVPDEGAMVEAGIAWANNKVIVIFRSDSRSLIEGNCNPLVLGLSDFSHVAAYDEIALAFGARFSTAAEDELLGRDSQFDAATRSGREIYSYLTSRKSGDEIADLLIDLFGERICRSSEDPKGSCSQVPTQP
jgi:nucleoside 2-deoxyribosyltransferase